MPVEFDDSGFRKLEKRLRDMSEPQKIEFSPEFMRRWTDYESMDALVAASGFSTDEIRAFLDTTNKKWEQFIRDKTRFSGWRDFMEKLSIEHLRRQFPECQ
jgi:hypothetical protein